MNKLIIILLLLFVSPAFAKGKKPVAKHPPAPMVSAGHPISGWHVGGAVVGTFAGFGLGHPFQGRYLERGWMFTLSQAIAGPIWLIGTMGSCEPGPCRQNATTAIAGIVYVGSRLFEVFDLWTHLRPGDPNIVLVPSSESKYPLVALNWKF